MDKLAAHNRGPPHQVDRTAPAVPQGTCLGCGRHRFRGPVKGLGSKANTAWLKTAGVICLQKPRNMARALPVMGGGSSSAPYPAPYMEHVSDSYLERGIYTHTFFYMYTL